MLLIQKRERRTCHVYESGVKQGDRYCFKQGKFGCFAPDIHDGSKL